ncbi:response regulator [Isosphaeraceae bacterium EP7]
MSSEIVLADDDADLRKVYATWLRTSGYTVWEAANGAEALALVRDRKPGLLLLDVWMPAPNGIEVLEALKLDPVATRMRVVMLSSLGEADTRLECFALGASDYLVKGLALTDLKSYVDRALQADPAD